MKGVFTCNNYVWKGFLHVKTPDNIVMIKERDKDKYIIIIYIIYIIYNNMRARAYRYQNPNDMGEEKMAGLFLMTTIYPLSRVMRPMGDFSDTTQAQTRPSLL